MSVSKFLKREIIFYQALNTYLNIMFTHGYMINSKSLFRNIMGYPLNERKCTAFLQKKMLSDF